MRSTSGFLACAFAAIMGGVVGGTAFAADAPPGATSCSGCHAVNAAADTPVPKITGRNESETVALMAEFRSGAKPSTVMGRIAKGFTDDETKAIAAWLAAQK